MRIRHRVPLAMWLLNNGHGDWRASVSSCSKIINPRVAIGRIGRLIPLLFVF